MALLTNINGKFSVSDAGAVTFNNAFTFPTADGTANYVLKTNGSGQLAWAADNYENYDYWILQGDSAGNVNINSTNTLKFIGGTYIDTSATWAGGSNARKLTINHETTSRTDTTSTDAPAFGGTFEAVTSVTTNTTGHITAIDVSTITIPTEDGIVTGSGTLNKVARWTATGSDIGDGPITFATNDSTFAGRINGVLGGTLYNTAGLWLEGDNSTDGISIGGTGTGNKNIDTYGGALNLQETAQNGVNMWGNVGIGTSSTEGKLTISYTAAELPTSGTTSNSAIQVISSLNNQLNLGLNTVSGDYGAYIQASDNNLAVPYPLNLQPNGGNVGIGTTSPSSPLHVDGAPANGVYLSYLYNSATHNSANGLNVQTSSNNILTYGLRVNTAGDSNALAVMGNGSVGIGTGSPDAKLDVHAPSTTAPSLTMGAAAGQIFKNEDSELAFGLMNASPYNVWMQSRFSGDVARPFTINPLGGNVGIGTTGPNNKLEVAGNINVIAPNPYIWIGESGSGGDAGFIGWNDAANYLFIGHSYGSAFNKNIVISSSGNVGIGDTVPTSLSANTSSLTVNSSRTDLSGGYITKANGVVKHQSYWDSAGIRFDLSPSSGDFRWRVGGTAKMQLVTAGTLTVLGDIVAYGNPSDKRLKENIKPIESALDKVSKLQGVTFDWKESDSILNIKEDIGFIAQDVQKVIPELVRENEDGMLSMRHQGIAPILLEAIKELKAEIEELKFNKCNCNK